MLLDVLPMIWSYLTASMIMLNSNVYSLHIVELKKLYHFQRLDKYSKAYPLK